MKKLKVVLALLLVIGVVTGNCAVAQAAEEGMTVRSTGKRTVRTLTQEEVDALQLSTATDGVVSTPPESKASYRVDSYTDEFWFYLDDLHVATANIECIVYHYTDGKVHLYQRTITMRRLTTYDAGYTYGRIVNTDGSLSYTTGDRVHILGLTNTWDYAIDFRVTPSDASFSCYEV